MLLVAKVGIFKAKCDKNQPQTKQGLALSKRRYSRSSFQTEWRTPRRLWVKALVKNPILGTLTRTFHCCFALVSSFQDKTLTIFAFFRQICCIFLRNACKSNPNSNFQAITKPTSLLLHLQVKDYELLSVVGVGLITAFSV